MKSSDTTANNLIPITIIIVGFNEEENLPKLFASLNVLHGIWNPRIIYIDQESTDSSCNIAEEAGGEVYRHTNKGYADPDKKWAVEELCKDNDWCMILDADEELSQELMDEIADGVRLGKYDIFRMYRETFFMGISSGKAYEHRFFLKQSMQLTDTIHDYMQPISSNIMTCRHILKSLNQKDFGKDVDHLASKLNIYAEKEISKHIHLSNIAIILRIFWMPILHFFGWGIIHKIFLRGIRGYILCKLAAHYQFLIYSKTYEYKNFPR